MSDLMEDFAGLTVRDWACAVAWVLGIILVMWMVL